MEIQRIRDMVLVCIMVYAAWQDWKRRSISLRFLIIAGCIGILFSCLLERTPAQALISCGIGFLLLWLGRLTGGGIGDGDGWFFVVLGLYIDWKPSIYILLWGLGFSFWTSLFLVVRNCWKKEKRRRTLPFLSLLLPGGMAALLTGVFG